jgi:hypothetical protein
VVSSGDLTGWWSVTNRVESTPSGSAGNLNVGFRLKLAQAGNQITGTGHRWMEDGRQLPPSQQSTIDVTGSINGRRVELSFIEHGAVGPSAGTLVYDVGDTGVLHGRFSRDGAQASGTTQARRMP